jgi:hypothetical protein|tara:strand:- start:12735 stop:12920 length:186 start_codon:yes stop_codon:yes gene_type:complete
MAKIDAKSYLQSKTFWGAFVVVISGILASLGYLEVAATLGSIGAGLGLIGLRDASGKLKWK